MVDTTTTTTTATTTATMDGGWNSYSFNVMIISGCSTLLLASALAYLLLANRKKGDENGSTIAANGTDQSTVSSPTDDNENGLLVVDKKQYPGGPLAVYYATQTGTAESFARQIEREGPQHGFLVHVIDLETVAVTEDLVQQDVLRDPDDGIARAIFITSTYGEGEAPDNATVFVDGLKSKAGCEILFEQQQDSSSGTTPACLMGLEYCVFGLGNMQYDHYNAMSKFFDHALNKVGAKRIMPLGLGNDDDDLDGDFEAWMSTKLWSTLKERYLAGSDIGERPVSVETMPDCSYVVEYHDAADKTLTNPMDLPLDKVHASSRHYYTAVECPVKVVRELRTGGVDAGSTVHVEVDISGARNLSYETADNLGVLPMNDSTTVERVAKSLGYELDTIFTLKPAPHHEWHGAPFPMPISIRECLTRYCDLTSAPRRSDLKVLAAYAKDPVDKKALLRLSSKEGRAEYREKIIDGLVGLVDLFKLCPSVELPLEHFLDLCPRLQTRFFTISSSSSVHPDTVHLTVAVTREKRKDGSTFRGVCSNFLASLNPRVDTIRVFNRASTFRLPKDTTKPVIMIGPGTGVAPMRALLQERSHQATKLKAKVGKNVLYFGCKYQNQDYIYKEELDAFRNDGVLNELRVAFSREGASKVYVQHLLLQDAAAAWKLIGVDGAFVYVCGGVKMGHDVAEALKKIMAEKGNMSAEEAKDYHAKLTTEGRYVQELWS